MEQQETLHEVALKFAQGHYEMYETSNFGSMYFGFCWGAKWQQERSYTEEEVFEILSDWFDYRIDEDVEIKLPFSKWFKQFKKK